MNGYRLDYSAVAFALFVIVFWVAVAIVLAIYT